MTPPSSTRASQPDESITKQHHTIFTPEYSHRTFSPRYKPQPKLGGVDRTQLASFPPKTPIAWVSSVEDDKLSTFLLALQLSPFSPIMADNPVNSERPAKEPEVLAGPPAKRVKRAPRGKKASKPTEPPGPKDVLRTKTNPHGFTNWQKEMMSAMFLSTDDSGQVSSIPWLGRSRLLVFSCRYRPYRFGSTIPSLFRGFNTRIFC